MLWTGTCVDYLENENSLIPIKMLTMNFFLLLNLNFTIKLNYEISTNSRSTQ